MAIEFHPRRAGGTPVTARIIAFPVQPRIAAEARVEEFRREFGLPPLTEEKRALLAIARAKIAQLPKRRK